MMGFPFPLMTFYLLASITNTGISGTAQILAARLGQLVRDLPALSIPLDATPFATEPVNTVRLKAMIANLRCRFILTRSPRYQLCTAP
jgi:hypothetical protein